MYITSKQLTLLLIRLSLGIIYLTSGLSKLAPDFLGNIIGPVNLAKAYDDSNVIHFFMNVTAFIQIIVGALTLSQRYSVLGLVLLLPLSLGILIFTIFAGFGLTPIINGILLSLLIYALFQEQEAVKNLMKFKIESLKNSRTFRRFPDKRIPNLALVSVSLTAVLSFLNGPVLNVIATISLVLFFINLFQRKDYIILDYIILTMFFIISFIIINGMILNRFIPKAFYAVFLLIPVGFVLYILRLIYSRFVNLNQE